MIDRTRRPATFDPDPGARRVGRAEAPPVFKVTPSGVRNAFFISTENAAAGDRTPADSNRDESAEPNPAGLGAAPVIGAAVRTLCAEMATVIAAIEERIFSIYLS